MAQKAEVKAEIMRRWNEGQSAAIIGAALNMTRNVVIGIVQRNRDANSRIRASKPTKRKPKAYAPRKPQPERAQPSMPELPRPRLPVIPSNPRYEAKGTCQYFIDDKKCGAGSNGSWCPEHKKIVHVDRSTTIKSNHQMYKTSRLFRI